MSSKGVRSSADGVETANGFARGDNDEAIVPGEHAEKIRFVNDPSLVDTDHELHSERESKSENYVTDQNDGGAKSTANGVADPIAPPATENKLNRLSSSVEQVDLDFSLGSLESPRSLNKRRGISLEQSPAPSSSASAKKRKISSVLPIHSLAEALQPEFWQDSAAVSEHNIASASFDVGGESGGSSPFSVEHGVEGPDEVDETFMRKLSDEDRIRIIEAEEVMRVASLAAEAESPPTATGAGKLMCDATIESATKEGSGKDHVEFDGQEQNVMRDTDDSELEFFSSSASLREESHMTLTDEEYSRPLPPAPPSTPAMSRDIFAPLPFQSQLDVGGGKISFSDEIRRDELNGTVQDPFDADATTPPRENAKPPERRPLWGGEKPMVEGKINETLPTQKYRAEAPLPDMSGSVTEPRRGGGAGANHRPMHDARSDFEKWEVGDRYQLKRLLGRGSYGEVAQAIDMNVVNSLPSTEDNSSPHNSPAYVAVKRIRNAFDQETDAIRLYRELHILRRLRGHACVIQLYDVVQPSCDIQHFNNLYLVFEYVDTDLYKLIMSPQYLTTEHIQTFLYQMLVGVKYIHSSSVIHRDLKPAILVNENCTLKICDFGLARIVQNDKISPSTASQLRNDSFAADTFDVSTGEQTSATAHDVLDEESQLTSMSRPNFLSRQLTKHVVTRWYRAPELILIQPYSSSVDIWSLGCIFGELLSMQEGSVQNYQNRVPLFPGGSCYPLSRDHISTNSNERRDQLNVIFGVIGLPSEEDLKSVGKANEYVSSLKTKPGRSLESLYPAADPLAIDLLKKMLMFNPSKRCTAAEALNHEFLKPVRRKEMENCATQPLESPKFLETSHIDVAKLKEETYKEVLWYSRS